MKKLQNRLLAYFLPFIVFLLFMLVVINIWIVTYGFRDIGLKEIENTLTGVKIEIEGIKKELLNLALAAGDDKILRDQIQQKDRHLLFSFLEKLKNQADLDKAVLLDRKGNILADINAPSRVGSFFQQKEIITKFREGTPLLSIENDESGLEFQVVYPLRVKTLQGFLVLGRALDYDFLKKIKSIFSHEVFLYSGETLLASTETDPKRIERFHHYVFGKEVFHGSKDAIITNRLAPEKHFVGTLTLLSQDKKQVGSLFFTLSMEKTNEIVKVLILSYSLFFLFLVLVTVMFCYKISLKIVNPLKMLSITAREISKGKFATRVPVETMDEIGALADSFNTMAKNLSETLEREKQLSASAAVAEAERKNAKGLHDLNQTLKTKNQQLTASEQQLKASNLQLLVMVGKLEASQREAQREREKAEKASKTKSQFLANMSHEIRTPMNAILGFLDLLKPTPLNEQQQDYVETVISSGKLLVAIINDVLDMSKIESGEVKIEKIGFDLNTLVENNISVVKHALIHKPITLHYEIEKNVPHDLEGDPTRLSQILMNLLNNAIKFTGSGEVSLHVSLEKKLSKEVKLLKFDVKDTGVGIAAERLEIIFDSFVQEDQTTTREFGGTGLGLYICKSFSNLMGGDITVESKKNEGSVFSVTIPFSEKVGQKYVSHSEIFKEKLKGLRVLLVDDNETNLKLIRSMCSQIDLFLTEKKSALEAQIWLEEMSKKKNALPDIGLIDTIMPEKNGYDFIRHIRSLPEYDPIKFVALISDPTSQDPFRSVTGEFDAYISKPVMKWELLSEMISVSMEKKNTIQIEAGPQEALDQQNVRVLVVEDNRVNQKLIIAILETLSAACELAKNGRESIAMIRKTPYDLVLMDLHMPIMGGLEATTIIRKDLSKTLPIIGLSAASLPEDETNARNAGMNDFLLKPVDIARIKEMILKWSVQKQVPRRRLND